MLDPLAAARDLLAEDPDPETRGELEALLRRAEGGDEAARRDLADRMSGPLQFGTAGLRGRVEAGLARMNRLAVVKATWGLGSHLLDEAARGGPDPRSRGVVVGFDGRHSSRGFAEDAAAVLGGLGIVVHLFPDPIPTPLLSFSVPHLRAAAGLTVTASHNPPADNGYKVYLASGAQIVPPIDVAIAARIAAAPRAGAIARPTPADAARGGLRRLVDVRDAAVEEAYLDGLAGAALHEPDATPLRVAYTAMHGVGHRLAVRALARAGFLGVATEPAQADPDGAFRTVSFPNPEEPGAMDRVLGLATETEAELVLANDPDADRLAAAVPDPSGRGYRMLSGNELGALLGDDAMEHAATGGRPKLVVTTVVSSSLLSRMARDRGVACRETLTGFKWIADAALGAERDGLAFVFGYEEALGYTVGPLVRDKDGIGAALRLAELARFLKRSGRTLLGRLDDLLVAHGLSHQVQWSVVLPGAEGRVRIDAAMAGLRASPPQRIGGSPVVRVLDAEKGEERIGGERRSSGLPRSDVLAFQSEDGARLTVRPSGTEPKIKFYLELVGEAKERRDVAPVRARLEAEGQALRSALTRELHLA
ncbi:MAG TPA: phospho-sugar mutase [Vicinamibacteria bacterium]|nr:phospho-sugar mutase [Vicinamibacteria bacterium]